MVDTPPRSQRKKNFPPRRASEQRKDVGAAPEPRVPYAQAAEPQPETVEFTAFEETEFEETETARSEEHTSELQSLMRISYAVFCLKKKTHNTQLHTTTIQ